MTDFHPNDFDRAAELLHDAADVLDRDGWTQGQLADEQDRVCVLGALLRTQDGECYAGFIARELAIRLLESEPGIGHNHIVLWNDAPGRTLEDVKLALKHAEQRALDRAEALS